MTDLLKQLLQKYGMLYFTLTKLESDRPGSPYSSYEEYFESLGDPEEGEPIVIVRISKDGEARFIHDVKDPTSFGTESQKAKLTIWELPEDEYYFFKSFRGAAFDLDKSVPSFLLQMSFVYGYEAFEAYLEGVIRSHVATSLNDPDLDRRLNRIMRAPIVVVLKELRNILGQSKLPAFLDRPITKFSLIRNCLLHNSGAADAKLAAFDPAAFAIGQSIEVTVASVSEAISEFRKAALAIDAASQSQLAGNP